MKKNSFVRVKLFMLSISTWSVLFVFSSHAFSTGSECKNSFVLNLNTNLKLSFCEIPAAQNISIGSESGRPNEMPVTQRNFEKFQVGQFVITQLQYRAIMKEEPWKDENGVLRPNVQESDDNPAVYVNYFNAIQFVKNISKLDPTAVYRLPTDAEFEYAARAGSLTNYFWGDAFNSDYAYFMGNTKDGQYARRVDSCPLPNMEPLDSGYCANGFGLFHMLGNVWQWTADAAHNYVDAPIDGNEAVQGDENSPRSMRGGSWASEPTYLRSSFRYFPIPTTRYRNLGFRLIRIEK